MLALLALVAWSLASPIGSSPDDDYHLASIWCANSANTAACEPGPKADERYVPEAVHRAPYCYNFKSGVSAACQSSYFSLDPSKKVLTDRGSFTGSYPPVYYATMSLFVGDNILLSVIVMRIVNSALFVALTTALFLLLPRIRRPTLIWSWLVTTVPLGLFLLASNNPSAWSIIGIGSLWIALLGYFETAGRRRIGLGAIVTIATIMAAGARADSAVYAVISIAVVFVLTFRRTRSFYLAAILPIGLAIMSGIFYLTSGQSSVASTGLNTPGAAPASLSTILLYNLENVQQLWVGAFGVWQLGWVDTPMPWIVIFGAVGAILVVVFSGLAKVSRRKLTSVGIVGLVLWLLPLYVLQQGRSMVGEAVQPRYLLPLIILFVGLALLPVGHWFVRFSRLQLILIAVAVIVAQSVALHENMRRYITGIDVGGLNLNRNIEWWWPIQISPMTVWIVGSLAFAGATIILIREISRASATPATAPHAIPPSTTALTD
ncbi:DUF2142 domain-containing protein [Lysinimonas soli]|uniref:DUF2142 domain-containing protein n=1 Tax=Lysinimonas soli TaxID=1074233 RepID=A0ABW0NSA9_9MICO